jgi:hypothetical protein
VFLTANDVLAPIRQTCMISLLVFCVALAGCRGECQCFTSQATQGGNSSVVLAITDTPPSDVSILSAKVTLTGATLTPGNIPLLPGSSTVELTKLQTDTTYIATATDVASGSYTGLTLTFANPLLTIKNDTMTAIVSGSISCQAGSICTIAPTAVSNLSVTIPLTSFMVAPNSSAGLLIDVNLDGLVSSTAGEDFQLGTTVSPFIPAGTGAPLVGAEDVVGQVGNISTSNNTFTLQNATGFYSLTVDSSSTFFQFPSSACSIQGFACLNANQILSLDIGIQSDGSISAKNIVFEDGDNSDAEVEGVVTSTNPGAQQFNMVIVAQSALIPGSQIGDEVTVQYSIPSPVTPFDIDFVHADNVPVSTAGFTFSAPMDLAVGQEVSIRRNSNSSSSLLRADRVRLRSSRLTANILSNASSVIGFFNIPSIYTASGTTTIQGQTPPPTICSNTSNVVLVCSNVPVGALASARGPLFNIGGSQTMISTRVIKRP